MNMRGRNFRQGGMGELPSTALNENGSLAISPPFGRPPNGNASAPTQPGMAARILGDNQSSWQFITFTAGVLPIKIQDSTYRKFFLIQNKSATATMFIGLGYQPNLGNGLVLVPGQSYEPFSYPINEIYVSCDSGTADGLFIYGV
jgi:hypothetical protein